MQRGRSQTDYEPVTRTRRRRLDERADRAPEVWPTAASGGANAAAAGGDPPAQRDAPAPAREKDPATFLRRGHALTYAALFLFTVILYARPAEFYPSPWTASIAFIIGIVTLAAFIPSQLSLEGVLTARPREINLVLLFCLAGLLSIPLAISREDAWGAFSDTFIRCVVIFIVMVNVVRTEARLKGLLFLALAVSIWLSLGAINDYRLGLMTVEGYRVGGRGKGIFGNSNDMALHLATIVPIAIALLFGSRHLIGKFFYGAAAALMVAAIVLTYSRGAFIGLLVLFVFMAWKIGRHHRLGISLLILVGVTGLLLLAPGNYARRLLSIFDPSLDPVGSSDARRSELFRSISVALHNPVLGIGMGNYATQMSDRALVTHNSYTQVAAEMGLAALYIYTMFIVTPFRRLGQLARETSETPRRTRYYYLAIGLQASLLCYMVTSFFASVAYLWYPYYLVAYAVCLRRLYESETGSVVATEKERARSLRRAGAPRGGALVENENKVVAA
jgi:O-antigen ligase